jgi:hypothetical protein
MAIPEAYVVAVGNISRFLDAIQTAGVPPRVTFEFIKTLGFKSSNDRSLIRLAKAIGFLDENGVPTSAYREYRDPNRGPKVLAEALRKAYEDLFLANTKANELSVDKLKGIIATKTSKGDRVITEVARTFNSLAKKADFSADVDDVAEVAEPSGAIGSNANETPISVTFPRSKNSPASFHYNIQIHLPTTTDITVYNAIFKSLRDNLL